MVEKALLVCWSGFTKEKRDKREMESEPETVYERGGREGVVHRSNISRVASLGDQWAVN